MAHAAADGGRAGAAAVGAPLRVWAHISLADLMRLPGSAELVAQWAAQLHARWAGQRAAAAEEGGHQGLWLDGDAVKGSRAARRSPR